MTRDTDSTDGEHALADLAKALGALLEDLRDARLLRQHTARPLAATPAAPPVTPPPAVPSVMPPPEEQGLDDEVGLLLSDARERAQAIIDESINRAQELLRAQPSSQALERIRRTVADMAVDVRAIHSRLDEIEALIRGSAVAYRAPAVEARPAPQPPAPPMYAPAPVYAPPPAPAYAPQPPEYPPAPVYAAPPAPTYAPPPPAPPAYTAPPPVPQYQAPEPPPAPPMPMQPTVAPPPPPVIEQAPPSAVPPMPAAPPPPPPPAAEVVAPPPPPPPAAPQPVAPPPAAQAPSPAAPAPAAPTPTSRGFDPAAGSVALRISPVAGFQGLMRVQDALARCRGVREAGVEAYAQGEARLRLHFAEPIDGTQLAASLAEALGRGVRLAAESTSERTVQLALE
jgi:hypothetical protein